MSESNETFSKEWSEKQAAKEEASGGEPGSTSADFIDSIKSEPDKGPKVVETPNGAILSVKDRYKKQQDELVFLNFQLPRRLKNQIDIARTKNRINVSEYFRKCGEILVLMDDDPFGGLQQVGELAKSLVFKRKSSKKKK